MSNLTFYERQKIEFYLRLRWGRRKIARHLKRDHTVISREISRNSGASGYHAQLAQATAEQRAKKTNKRKLDKFPKLKHYVIERMKKDDWSPEQIAGRLKRRPPIELVGQTISHESIYDYIYNGSGRYEHLYPYLRRGQSKRQKQHSRKPQKVVIPERISIHLRPEIIDKKERFGDWESDTMAFRKQKPALSVQYERKAMLARLHKVANKTAQETEVALIKTAESIPRDFHQSLTFDNGGEGACHLTLRKDYGFQTYFCDAYASWQKGGVENLNGLIRQYLPRDTDVASLTDFTIHCIQEKLNNRPRKSLQYKTPNEVVGGVI